MRRKYLSTEERNQLVQFLLENSQDGKIMRGKIAAAVSRFTCSRRTVFRLWAEAKKQQETGKAVYLKSAKVHISRTKRVSIDLELISSLELLKRSTIRSLAQGIHQSKSTVERWIKQGLIKAHTSAIKPDLTAPNKLLRLRFSLEALEVDTLLKTLRPIYGPNDEVVFDGKIGIFPFTKKVPAQRTSKNRPAGTLETKSIESVTKEVVRECLITKILPAIKAKWPQGASKNIHIQQDNAKPHISNDDPMFREAANQDGFTFTLVQQPPNSPDTNVNDLGWFRAIQSLQIQSQSNTIDQLIQAVHNSFEELSPKSLNNVFLSLQGCMIEIMRVRGENRYKIPHMQKGALIRASTLPLNLEVPHELVRECLTYLLEEGSSTGIEQLVNTLGIHLLESQ